MESLRKHVEDYPDAYQYERAKLFGVSPNCILYALRRLKISHKKTLVHPKANGQLRAAFKNQLFFYESKTVIYLDESGFAIDAPRIRGYSLKGTRCYGSRDWHSRGRVNTIGAIHQFKMLNVCLFEGNINADIFYSWVTQQLLPSLPERAVIVMDNATFHKRSDTIKAIESKGK